MAWVKRVREGATSVLSSARVRAEVGWVALQRLVEFGILFVGLKILTTQLGEQQYGEYSLAMTAIVLVTALAVLPVLQPFLRYYHAAEERGEGRATALWVLRRHLAATLAVLALTGMASVPLSRWLDLSTGTLLAAGVVFFANRWRWFGVEVLNMRRQRRAFALHATAFELTQVLLVGLTVYCVQRTAAAALWAYALAAGGLALIGVAPLVRQTLRREAGAATAVGTLVWSFGVPFGALTAFQWVQSFSDRYLVAWQLGLAAAGKYAAAFQVCGIPYMFLGAVLDALLRPVVYQRGKDAGDPRQLWSADKVLFGALGVYLVLGALLLPVYALLGPKLLVALTSAEFELPRATIIILALSRYVQSGAFLLQMFFEVHQIMAASFVFRLAGALLAVPLCWAAIHVYQDVIGAALGALLTGAVYATLLLLGPSGVTWIVLRNRRRLARPGPAAAD